MNTYNADPMNSQFVSVPNIELMGRNFPVYNPDTSNEYPELSVRPALDPINLIANQFRSIEAVKEIYLSVEEYDFDIYLVVSGDPKLAVAEIAKAESELLEFIASESLPLSLDVHIAPDNQSIPAENYNKIYPLDPRRKYAANDGFPYAFQIGTYQSSPTK